ncbi:MAG: protein-L-isoaspartate(D-aspartate) O-methyltransferase [Planctomycetaceae bacterium]
MNIEQEQRLLRRQLEARGIRDPRVLDAIERTRRDFFVPEELRDRAYEDIALPIGEGQTISQPYIVALMTEALALQGDENVLEIGTGSGYQAAMLCHLCRHVVTIERREALQQAARILLDEIGCENIEYAVGDGTLGYPERAPYDGILVTAAAPVIPRPLFDQLADGGRLVVPVGDEFAQELQLVRREGDGAVAEKLCDCRFVKLIGAAGWPGE